MSDNTTKLLLDIEDNHIEIDDGARESDGIIRLNGTLDYLPKACPHCGIINEIKDTIKILKFTMKRLTTLLAHSPLEGSNNKIKVIKHVSFGYHRSFISFKIRILYIFRIKTKRALITK